MFAAIVLAGGAGRRIGGAVKPALSVGGRSMLSRVLGAVAEASPTIVVGPGELTDLLPADVVLTRESPPGGGPVAAIAAGLTLATATGAATTTGTGGDTVLPVRLVVVLAGDLPFLSPTTIAALRQAMDPTINAAAANSGTGPGPATGGAPVDGAVLVDAGGRPQWLAGVWRVDSLTDQLAKIGDPTGRAMRELVADLRVAHVPVSADPPPWFDCDTAEDIRQAEEWARVDIG